ncbi:MAG: DUF4215 domain-containing protein [Deltaproteobacteria bacterium]
MSPRPLPRAVALTVLALALGCAACGARTGLETPDASDDPEPDSRGDGDPEQTPPVYVGPDAHADVTATVCGNGVQERGEACDLGDANALSAAFTVSQVALAERAIAPVVRREAAPTFYGYSSASAHTGFELVSTSNVFLYADATDEALSLFTLAGLDGAASGPRQLTSTVGLTLSGIPTGARVTVSDDPGEFTLTQTSVATALWSFVDNTDGGVLGDLPWDTEWTLTLDERFTRGVTAWRCVDGDGSMATTLALSAATLIRHRVRAPACRPDCSVPRCGDGVLDAGEHCDDGNTQSGDGCRGDCSHIE